MGVTVRSGPYTLAGEFVPQLFSVPYSSLSEPDVVQLGQLPPCTTSALSDTELFLGVAALGLGLVWLLRRD